MVVWHAAELEYLRILNSMNRTEEVKNRINALCDSIEEDLNVWYQPPEPVNKGITLTIDGERIANAVKEYLEKKKSDGLGGTT